MSKVKKVVLAYSGGLDTSVILKWLINTYQCDVVTMTANLGQPEDLSGVEEKAYKTGAYTDRLGRHVPERHYKPGVSRGSIPALKYMDATRASVEGGIFSILRHDIERAVNQRLQNAL